MKFIALSSNYIINAECIESIEDETERIIIKTAKTIITIDFKEYAKWDEDFNISISYWIALSEAIKSNKTDISFADLEELSGQDIEHVIIHAEERQ